MSCSVVPFRFSELTAWLFSPGGFLVWRVLYIAFRAISCMTSLNSGFLLIETRYNRNFQHKMYCMLEHEGQCPNTFPEHGDRWRMFSRLFPPQFYSVIRPLEKMVHFETIFLPAYCPQLFFLFFSVRPRKNMCSFRNISDKWLVFETWVWHVAFFFFSCFHLCSGLWGL